MKRKTKKDAELVGLITTIQEQLAVLDKKFDHFMTKSLTELAQAMAAAKPAPVRPIFVQQPANRLPVDRPARPMFAVVCYSCGEDCEIPFKPSGNRPVYCQVCFAKRKEQSRISRTTPISLVGPKATSTIISKAPVPKSKTIKKAVKKKRAPKKKAAARKASAKKKSAPKKKTTKKKTMTRKKAGRK